MGGEPLGLGSAGRTSAALAVWMAAWRAQRDDPVYATALLPLAVLPLAAGMPMVEAPPTPIRGPASAWPRPVGGSVPAPGTRGSSVTARAMPVA